jgi:plastocyanin domain-containing protein
MRHLLGASVVVLGLGLGLLATATGCNKKTEATPAPPAAPSTAPVAITVDADGFKPSSVTFKKGTPGTLIFTRTVDDTCATEVVFPQLDIKKELPKNTPVTIVVPTDKEQKLTFQCGMGMYKSSVVVSPGS